MSLYIILSTSTSYYLTERELHHGVVPVRGWVTVIDPGSSLTWTTLLHVGLPDTGPGTRAPLSPSSSCPWLLLKVREADVAVSVVVGLLLLEWVVVSSPAVASVSAGGGEAHVLLGESDLAVSRGQWVAEQLRSVESSATGVSAASSVDGCRVFREFTVSISLISEVVVRVSMSGQGPVAGAPGMRGGYETWYNCLSSLPGLQWTRSSSWWWAPVSPHLVGSAATAPGAPHTGPTAHPGPPITISAGHTRLATTAAVANIVINAGVTRPGGFSGALGSLVAANRFSVRWSGVVTVCVRSENRNNIKSAAFVLNSDLCGNFLPSIIKITGLYCFSTSNKELGSQWNNISIHYFSLPVMDILAEVGVIFGRVNNNVRPWKEMKIIYRSKARHASQDDVIISHVAEPANLLIIIVRMTAGLDLKLFCAFCADAGASALPYHHEDRFIVKTIAHSLLVCNNNASGHNCYAWIYYWFAAGHQQCWDWAWTESGGVPSNMINCVGVKSLVNILPQI